MTHSLLTKRAFLSGCGCAVCGVVTVGATEVWAADPEGEVVACGITLPEAEGSASLSAAEAELQLENSGIITTSSEEAAAMRIHPKWGRWNPKRIDSNNPRPLRVGFLDQSHSMTDIVVEAAREWERHMGLEFDFSATGDFDILVQFDTAGNNSYLGAASRHKAKKGLPSLRLQRFTVWNSKKERLGIAKHELGHALGLIHEHQNPAGNIEFDEEAVLAYYWSKYGWDEAKTRRNVLDPYTSAQVDEMTGLDPDSIMMYALPQSLLLNYTNGFSKNYTLSDSDIELIGRIYPKVV